MLTVRGEARVAGLGLLLEEYVAVRYRRFDDVERFSANEKLGAVEASARAHREEIFLKEAMR